MPGQVNVMHLRAANFVGGPEKQILEHCRRMDPDRFQMVLTTFRENGQDCSLFRAGIRMGIRCCSIEERSPLDPRMVRDLVSLIRTEKIHILCTHGYKPDIIGRLAAWVARIPIIVISRGWTWESAKIRFFEAIDRRFMKWADHAIAVSKGQRDKVLQCGVKPERVSVIYNGIDVASLEVAPNGSFRQEMGIVDDALLVVSAGRLSPEKNFAGFIDAAVKVLDSFPGVYFAVFGEGALRRDLERRILDAGLEGSFFLPGFREDLVSLLAEADVFVLPSFTEGLPNVVLEAFAHCKPVVATAVGGTPEVVRDKESGFLVEPHETGLLAQHIVELCKNPEMRRRMGEAGYADVKKCFNYESQSLQYENLYLKLAVVGDPAQWTAD